VVIGISPVVWYDDDGWVRLKDGVVEIGRAAILGDDGLTKFTITDKTQGFRILVRLESDDTEVFNTVAIISDITQLSVSFLIKNEVLGSDILEALADIDSSPATYTQGRVAPQVWGTYDYVDCPILDNATKEFYIPFTDDSSAVAFWQNYLYQVHDDGVLVPFDGIVSAYSIGEGVEYGDYAYTANGNTQTMSPTGAATNNTDWNHSGAATGSANLRFKVYTTNWSGSSSFTLLTAPVGRVTASIDVDSGPVPPAWVIRSGMADEDYNTIKSDEIYVNAGGELIDPQSRFGDLWGYANITSLSSYVYMTIAGSASNDGKYKIATLTAGTITIAAGFTPEAAGSNITLTAHYVVDYAQFNFVNNLTLRLKITRQQKKIELYKALYSFYSNFFYFKKGIVYVVGRTKYLSTITTDAFEIEQKSPPNLLIENSVFAYRAEWEELVPIQNPVELLGIQRNVVKPTGVETGGIVNVRVYDENETTIGDALDDKVDIFTDYSQFEVTYTKDEVGIDTNLLPGVRLQFSDWVSGDMIVHEVEWDIEMGINKAKGIAKNLVYA
jgi:hypothetical protein